MATTATPLTSTPYKASPFYRLSALPDYLNPFDEPKVTRNRQRSDEIHDTNPLPSSSPSDHPNPFLDPSTLSAPEFSGRSSSSEDCNSFEMSGIAQDEEVESISCCVLHPSRHVFLPAWHSGMYHCYKAIPFLPSVTACVPSRMAQWHVPRYKAIPLHPSQPSRVCLPRLAAPFLHGMHPRNPITRFRFSRLAPSSLMASIPVTRLYPSSYHGLSHVTMMPPSYKMYPYYKDNSPVYNMNLSS